MSLLDTYERMKLASVSNDSKEEMDKLASERIELLAKYAQAAEELLQEKHGNDYALTDVEELAGYLIENDRLVEVEEQAKVAELVEAGKVLAASFVDEVNNLTETSK